MNAIFDNNAYPPHTKSSVYTVCPHKPATRWMSVGVEVNNIHYVVADSKKHNCLKTFLTFLDRTHVHRHLVCSFLNFFTLFFCLIKSYLFGVWLEVILKSSLNLEILSAKDNFIWQDKIFKCLIASRIADLSRWNSQTHITWSSYQTLGHKTPTVNFMTESYFLKHHSISYVLLVQYQVTFKIEYKPSAGWNVGDIKCD